MSGTEDRNFQSCPVLEQIYCVDLAPICVSLGGSYYLKVSYLNACPTLVYGPVICMPQVGACKDFFPI